MTDRSLARAQKIVVLDGHTMNPGDLDWAPLRELGAEFVVHPRTAPGEIAERAADADVVLVNKVRLDRTALGGLPGLRYVGVTATGYDVVDAAAAREQGVTVTNVPAYGTPSVAQAVFALLLEMTNHVAHHAASVRLGRWTQSPDFCYWDFPVVELAGKQCGLVGFGQIAQGVARIAHGFGLRVVACGRPARDGGKSQSPQRTVPADLAEVVSFVDLDTLFRTSDVVSLHCPLTPETRHLVDATRLALMKPAAYLINTSRGPIVHEQDLADALKAGRLAGAGLDVLSVEPPPADNPLLEAPRCLVTPHVAWASDAARDRLLTATAANLRGFLQGEPRNVVNP